VLLESRASRSRGVMLHLNQIQRQKEQGPAQSAIEQKGQQVRTGKGSRTKEHERQHRMRNFRLDDQKKHEENNGGDERNHDRRVREAESR